VWSKVVIRRGRIKAGGICAIGRFSAQFLHSDMSEPENVIGRAVRLSWARDLTESVCLRPREPDLTSIPCDVSVTI
jgi:hypothetical protein